MVQFLEGRNRAWAQLDAPINGSDTNVALVAWQGSRLSDVTTASGRKVRAQIYERDAETGAITKCELVDITNNVSDVLIIERAVESTRATDTTNTYAATPQSFTANAIIEEVISSEVISELQDEVNRLEEDKLDKSVYDAERVVYATSSAWDDDYEILTGDSLATVTDGRIFAVRADVANTGAATLKVDATSPVALKKLSWGAFADLATWDIIANQIFFAMKNTAASCYQFSLDPATLSLTVSDADETTKGIAERATNIEALLFADVTRFINSLQLWLAMRVPEQDIPYAPGTITQNITTFQFQTNIDGSVAAFVFPNAAATQATIFRLERDNLSWQYILTHRATFSPSSGVDRLSVCLTSSYIFMSYSDWGTYKMQRYNIADLSGITAFTVSGTTWWSWNSSFSDGTDIYIYDSANVWNKYTLSGTVATFSSAITYTSAWYGNAGGATCDGTNVWIIGAQANATVIRKYAKAWGAVLSSATKYMYYDAYHATVFSPVKLWITKVWCLGIWFAHGLYDPSAMVWCAFKLMSITTP